jgi:asparaginyl-tRNA synthetase
MGLVAISFVAMGMYIRIADLKDYIGKQARIAGWLYHGRSAGKLLFLLVRDGSGICQCVVEKGKVHDDLFAQLDHLGQESCLEVTGLVRQEPRSPGGYELAVTGARIIAKAEGYPITPKPHGIDFLMRNRHLHLRSRIPWCIARIRHTVVDAIRRFFNDRGFTLVDTPIITTIAGEEVGSLFRLDYFGQPVALTQTGQLYLEAAAASLGRVYCFGPTFRAEKSKTRRHLTEFWMAEPEVAFINLSGLIELAEDLVCAIVERVLEDNHPELETIGADIEALARVSKPFYRLTYTQVADLLTSSKTQQFMQDQLQVLVARRSEITSRIAELEAVLAGSSKQWQRDKAAAELIELRSELADLELRIENNPKHAQLAAQFQWGKDLGGSDETIVSQMFDKPVFVTHYPRQAKAFYMRQDRSDPKVVENFDLLAPNGFGEIIGGSMREEDYELLAARMDQEGLKQEDYWWYLDLRRYGSFPHGGFGLGLERTVAWITGQRHVRQCIAFPRIFEKL